LIEWWHKARHVTPMPMLKGLAAIALLLPWTAAAALDNLETP
jgi:hypothetical protein